MAQLNRRHVLGLGLGALGAASFRPAAASEAGVESHGLSVFGDLKYPADFHHFDFVNLNPQIAPGGKLNPAFARGDVCHLNAAAYRLWGNAIDSILSRHGI